MSWLSAYHVVLAIVFQVLPHVYAMNYDYEGDSVDGKQVGDLNRPWDERHLPPPTPHLPPLPPIVAPKFRARSRLVNSVCNLPVCSCNSRLKENDEEVIDIKCTCSKDYKVLIVGEPMLPDRADTLEISSCSQVKLTGIEGDLGGGGIGGKLLQNSFKFHSIRQKRNTSVDLEQDTPRNESGIHGRQPSLSFLKISQVRRLSLLSHAVGPVVKVRLEDIEKIPALPPFVFQPSPLVESSSNKTDFKWQMHSVDFRNISEIERVSEGAFTDVSISSHFLWMQVNIVIMEDNAVRILFSKDSGSNNSCGECSDEDIKSSPCEIPKKSIALWGSLVGAMDIMSFNVKNACAVSIDGCHISQLGPSSISVHGTESFSFTRNHILRSVAPLGFDVEAKTVVIRRNRFGALEEGALVGVKPLKTGILTYPTLEFEDNLLEEIGPMSLNVGWKAFSYYSKRKEIPKMKGFSFKSNSFADCSCQHAGWIVQIAKDHLDDYASFYALLLEGDSGNYCAKEPLAPIGLHLPCRLPLAGLKDLFERDGKTCKSSLDVEELCAKFSSSVTSSNAKHLSQGLIVAVVVLRSVLSVSLFR